MGAYLTRLHAAAAHDAHLATAFIRVAGLVSPPQSLLRPGIALRVLRGGRTPPPAHGRLPHTESRNRGGADRVGSGDRAT